MTLRPVPALWFELLTVREDLTQAMTCLAKTGAVELEAHSEVAAPLLVLELQEGLQTFHKLEKKYDTYWPHNRPPGHYRFERPARMLQIALKRLHAWENGADPLIKRLERLSDDLNSLEQLREILVHSGTGLPDFSLLSAAGPTLGAGLFLLQSQSGPAELPAHVLHKRLETPAGSYLLVVGRSSDVAGLEEKLKRLKAQPVPLPDWLPRSASDAKTAVERRLADVRRSQTATESDLEMLSRRHGLAAALSDLRVIDWLNQHADVLRATDRLAWITGWRRDTADRILVAALEKCGVRYLLNFTDAPAGKDPPLVLRNPLWVRKFEVFARMLGTPTRHETDPSVIVAIMAPLLFGYMFGDVGQGFVIFLAGLILSRRVAMLRILVPGGLMAMVFGVLFGSVFSREDLIRPLWLHPLDQPITILMVTAGGGAAILTLGLLLDAIQAYWRDEGLVWLRQRAGFLVSYLGLLSGVLFPKGLWVASVGALWFTIGAATVEREGRLTAMGKAVLEYIEQMLQIIVNTVSFFRVGAFALAHAGLSAAIVGVAESLGGVGYWLVLVIGNALVILLEGLVVGIQTTRLVLFEFFIRFLKMGGRAFRPLPPPDIIKTNT